MFAVQKATKNLVADRIFMLPFLMEPQTKYTLVNNASPEMQCNIGPLNDYVKHDNGLTRSEISHKWQLY